MEIELAKKITSINRLSRKFKYHKLAQLPIEHGSPFFKQFLPKIKQVLDINGIALSGGFYFSKPGSDFDFHFYGDVDDDQLKKVDRLFVARKKVEMCSTISYYYNGAEFQFAKCVYRHFADIIYNFDIDPCRVVMVKQDNEYKVFTTLGGLNALVNGWFPVDVAVNTSPYRINKYQKKGFRPVHINGTKMLPQKKSTDNITYKFATDRESKIWRQLCAMFTDEYYFVYKEIFLIKDFMKFLDKLSVKFNKTKMEASRIIKKKYKNYVKSQHKHPLKSGDIVFPNDPSRIYVDQHKIQVFDADFLKATTMIIAELNKLFGRKICKMILKSYIHNYLDNFRSLKDLKITD